MRKSYGYLSHFVTALVRLAQDTAPHQSYSLMLRGGFDASDVKVCSGFLFLVVYQAKNKKRAARNKTLVSAATA